MLLFAVHVDETGGATPVVICAKSAIGPSVTAKYERNATSANLDLPDYRGFDFDSSDAGYFTGNPELLEKARQYLRKTP